MWHFPLLHLWQPDDGFRKCQALNHALVAARSDYVIFTDADCIPHRDFVAWHLKLAEPRCFLSGGYNKLSMVTSEALDEALITTGRHCDPEWLAAHDHQRLPADQSCVGPAINGRH